MGNFQRFRSGQHLKLNETTINAMIAAGENWAKHCNDPGPSSSPEYYFEGNVIQVRNDSGYDMPRFSVIGLTSPLISPTDNLAEFQNYPRFKVRVPILADSTKFAVLVEPLAVGAFGLAMVSGVVPCQIWRAPSDALPLYASAKVGTIAYLQSSGAGAGVLWCDAAPGSAGPVWALVRIPESTAIIIPFELKTDLTSGSYATAYPMKADESDADTSANTFTVYDEPEGDRRGLGRDTTGTSGGAHGVRGHAVYDSGSGHWQIISLGGQQSIWGKIQSSPTPTNASGATSQTFSVKTCKWDGTGETGSAFDVKTPIRANHDTALFTGYVIKWHIEPDSTKLIDSDCWDDPIGTIRAVGVDTAVRDGWEELTDARSRFLVGMQTGTDMTWDHYGDTGGTNLVALTVGLQDHPEGYGANCYASTYKVHTKLDGTYGTLNHRLSGGGTSTGAGSIAPPWYAVKWIKRTS